MITTVYTTTFITSCLGSGILQHCSKFILLPAFLPCSKQVSILQPRVCDVCEHSIDIVHVSSSLCKMFEVCRMADMSQCLSMVYIVTYMCNNIFRFIMHVPYRVALHRMCCLPYIGVWNGLEHVVLWSGEQDNCMYVLSLLKRMEEDVM